ncbi:HAD-like domain-containing protein [Microdochium trichocladiopsis]|uniref:HAD-like domain-containing protein n=1 Tax=Microdochium trichocladiopsis TaxID=1682393 RepID=A0A9P8XXL4_9PEZI|nr:HAD-like domain-containing protein [Microdochium trichocladiopsis]KAH7018357.1 HAD-like domain-containing protein [Microdochium trichocladiopsis]
MAPNPDLTSFEALSFDCFGTIIDEDAGMLRTLDLLVAQKEVSEKKDSRALLDRLHALIFEIEHKMPALAYNEVLVGAIMRLAKENDMPITDGLAEPFGNSAGTWLPFPDSIDALSRLKKYYPTFAILSNIDNNSIKATVEQRLAPIKFEGLYTAQDIGSYKPSVRNFEYLAGHMRKEFNLDCDRGQVLHVAHSVVADHVPCKQLGRRSVWISRGEDEKKCVDKVGGKDKVGYEWRFQTLGDFAGEVERQFKQKEISAQRPSS